VQLPTPSVRYILRGRTYIEDRGDGVAVRTLVQDELASVLSKTFGVELPSGLRIPDS
jgi:hypothetical protein